MQKRAERKHINDRIEFIVDADIISAKAINVSESGISFKTDEPIRVLLRSFHEDGTDDDNVAELVWARRDQDGKTTYGLQFTTEDP